MICEKCKSNFSSNYGSGRFCSRKCANTRTHSKKTNAKIADSLKGGTMHPNTRKALFDKDIIQRATENRIKSRDANRALFESTHQFEQWKRSWRYEYIVKRASGVCEECKLDLHDEDGRGPYEVHHIDGDRTNESEDNLQYLCLICHWKTDNYRFKGRTHTKESMSKQIDSRRRNGSIA